MISCIKHNTQQKPMFRGRLIFPLYETSTINPEQTIATRDVLVLLKHLRTWFPEYDITENTFPVTDKNGQQFKQMGEIYISKKLPQPPWYLKPFGFMLRHQARSTREVDIFCKKALTRLGIPVEKIRREKTFLKPEIRSDNLFKQKISQYA